MITISGNIIICYENSTTGLNLRLIVKANTEIANIGQGVTSNINFAADY